MRFSDNTFIFYSYSVEVCSIDEGGESDGDTVPELLLVSQAHLAAVVHLGPDHGPVSQDVLGADPELGGGPRSAPAQGDAGLQSRGELLEHRSSELGPVGEAGVEDAVSGRVAQAEVVFGNGGLGDVEAGLVAGEPALVAHHGRGVEGCETQVEVSGDHGRVMLVLSLQGSWRRNLK